MPQPLKLGLFSINMYACSVPEVAAQVARAAEAAGFESVWGGEHVVLPDPQAPPSPMAPQDRALDPLVALTYIAAHTSRVRLGTGIIILPQRNPLVLAKEMASLDVLSGGRLICGVGAGYLEPEFRALNAPFEHRGPRTVDYIEAMRAIWTQPAPAFQGRYFSFAGVQSHPHPLQQPHPPIVIGGHSPMAFRRAVEHCNGWYGYALDLAATERCLDGLKRAAARYTRPAELGELEITVTPRGRIDAETARQYAALGVQRLVLLPPRGADAEAIARFAAHTGEQLAGVV
ncbi:MAG TPA: TIGR03619 family F420-dependent LLM class oxidoreductase [Dehalococcoidia bacterium]|nr:TIGR03619 family F420-dependent LLM class oxidoreductase [Dehalococcoidia bacterium]